MIKRFLIPAAAVLCAVMFAGAASAENSAVVDTGTSKVTVDFNIGRADYALILITARNSGETIYANQLTAANGTVTDEIVMDSIAESGYYDVAVTDNLKNKYHTEFFFANGNYLENVFAEISEIKNRTDSQRFADLAALVEREYEVLGYNRENYAKITDKQKLCEKVLEENYSSIDEFCGVLSRIIDKTLEEQLINEAIDAFNGATAAQMTAALEKYSSEYGITLDNVYYKYADDVNKNLAAQKAESIGDVYALFEKFMVIPYVNEADRASLLETIKKYDGYLGIYDIISRQNDEIAVMILKKLEATVYTSAEQMLNDINAVIRDAKNGGTVKIVTDTTDGTYTVPKAWLDPSNRPQIIQDTNSDAAMPFKDLSGVKWAWESIAYLKDKGVIEGNGNAEFLPDNNITRAEFVKMLVRAFDITSEGEDAFDDVSSSDWFYEFVKTAKNSGMINGNENNEFMPNDFVTRQDAAVMIFRCLNMNEAADISLFDDDAEIAEYAKAAVYAMKEKDIISGTDNNLFEPHTFATRAQCAKMIYLSVSENRG